MVFTNRKAVLNKDDIPGCFKKMQTELGTPIQYYLVFKEDFVHLNTLLGREINIDFQGYECLNCHEDKVIFRQGFCKNCFFDTPKPEIGSCDQN